MPVAGTGSLQGIRSSRNARRRALVLLAVHLLVAAHATHFLIAGRTVSPVEPSESMYTLELGELNAGFVFFVVALLLTLIFGRFFCGWGCHLVALQDTCGWIMKKLGIRPRPFRSRLLMLVPLGLALYMFVYPSVRRWLVEGAEPFPGFSNHLMTDSFWKTFPGPVFAVLTFLTCGFAAVYLLGAKGFCTYGCPYGGFFVLVDRLAPGRIVVNDDCEQCGHCTATCTSNVLVHEEVRRYGRVVDPGCMKCMDCVSVCPKGALSFGFSRPSVLKGPPADPVALRRFHYGLGEEIFLAAVCLAAILAFRGLYDGPPLLMSVALGGITAFVAHKLWQLLRRPTVRLQRQVLKSSGKIGRSGQLFAAAAVLWLMFAAHSGFVQWHRGWGAFHLDRTEASREAVLSGAAAQERYSERHARAAERSLHHFRLADRWGLVDVVEVKLGLAWGQLLRGEPDAATDSIRAALSIAPERPRLHDNLIDLLAARGAATELIAALEGKLASVAPTAEDHFRLAGAQVEVGSYAAAARSYEASIALAPDVAESRYNYGGLLRRTGRNEAAIEQLLRAAELDPEDGPTRIELGLAYATAGETAAAIRSLRRAIELDPDSPESRLHLPALIRQLAAESGG